MSKAFESKCNKYLNQEPLSDEINLSFEDGTSVKAVQVLKKLNVTFFEVI